MSKLSEYIALIPKGLKDIPNIVSGIKNEIEMELGILPADEEEEIIRRRLICSECPYMSENAIKAGWYKTAREDKHCTMCGCPLGIRTASLDKDCGIETFNTNNPERAIPLKWEKFKKDEQN